MLCGGDGSLFARRYDDEDCGGGELVVQSGFVAVLCFLERLVVNQYFHWLGLDGRKDEYTDEVCEDTCK